MPDLRSLFISVAVGVGLGGYLTLWWHWALVLGWGAGLVLGGLTLVGTMSVARDPSIDDRAWQAAAPEFLDLPAEPGPASPDATQAPARSRDVPSGD